jgi:hypothetical protein
VVVTGLKSAGRAVPEFSYVVTFYTPEAKDTGGGSAAGNSDRSGTPGPATKNQRPANPLWE